MIVGPVFPRTRENLWDLVRTDPDLIETGLRLISEDLVLDGGVAIDALARDAAGTPVLAFISAVDEDRLLVARILEAYDRFCAVRGALPAALARGGAVDDPFLRAEREPRVIVVGYDYSETAIARLRGLDATWLRVLRVDGFSVGGQAHVAVTPVVAHASEAMASRVPPSWTGPGRAAVDRFVELLERLDPDLAVDGDPFVRRFTSRRGPLVDVGMCDGDVIATVPGAGSHRLTCEDSRTAVFDLVIRRYLSLDRGLDASPASLVTSDQPEDSDSGADAPPPYDVAPFSELRRRLDESELSQQEFDAFQSIDSES